MAILKIEKICLKCRTHCLVFSICFTFTLSAMGNDIRMLICSNRFYIHIWLTLVLYCDYKILALLPALRAGMGYA